jgi:hypothetical protein
VIVAIKDAQFSYERQIAIQSNPVRRKSNGSLEKRQNNEAIQKRTINSSSTERKACKKRKASQEKSPVWQIKTFHKSQITIFFFRLIVLLKSSRFIVLEFDQRIYSITFDKPPKDSNHFKNTCMLINLRLMPSG